MYLFPSPPGTCFQFLSRMYFSRFRSHCSSNCIELYRVLRSCAAFVCCVRVLRSCAASVCSSKKSGDASHELSFCCCWCLQGLQDNFVESYRKLPKVAEGYRRLPKVTEGCRRLPKVTESYRKLPKVTEIYRKLTNVTEGYRRLPKVAEGYRRLPKVTESYRRLPKVTESCRKLPKVTESYRKLPKVTSNYQKVGRRGGTFGTSCFSESVSLPPCSCFVCFFFSPIRHRHAKLRNYWLK